VTRPARALFFGLAAALGWMLFALAPPACAEVVTVDGATWLKGEIVPRDYLALSRRAREPGLVLHLDSRGGQVTSAVAIGRLLRATDATARVEAGASCISACVLVLAGAPKRSLDPAAVIGLHRPYDEDDARLPPEEVQRKQARLEAFIKSYLREVNVPTSLYESMLLAPQGRMLPRAELAWYGLDANDRRR
jgi:hypothetical protein